MAKVGGEILIERPVAEVYDAESVAFRDRDCQLPTPRPSPIDLPVEEGTVEIMDVETLRFRR
jgi:hypothetical protein